MQIGPRQIIASLSASYEDSDAATLGTGNGRQKCLGSVTYRSITLAIRSFGVPYSIKGKIAPTESVVSGDCSAPWKYT
jgi:hypothetical protein